MGKDNLFTTISTMLGLAAVLGLQFIFPQYEQFVWGFYVGFLFCILVWLVGPLMRLFKRSPPRSRPPFENEIRDIPKDR
jgi:hypothetical protein